MNQLLESKKVRERDRLRAQDVKIRREREKEGDEFDDKEVFITSAYKSFQEEMIKASEVEEKNSESNNASNFNRMLLEKTFQSRGVDIQSVANQSSTLSTLENLKPEAMPIKEEPEQLKAGLNVSGKRVRPPSPPSSLARNSKSKYDGNNRSSKRSEETYRILKQYEELQHQKETEKEKDREKVLLQVVGKSDSKMNAIRSARERYLKRKKHAAVER